MERAKAHTHMHGYVSSPAAAGPTPGRTTLVEQFSATDVATDSSRGRTTRSAQISAPFVVQRVAEPGRAQSEDLPRGGGDVQATAARGIASPSSALPHLNRIQQFFGRHDVRSVEAHIGGPAARACQDMGAIAFATGNHVAFRAPPDLHTAAHEAAHVIQQRGGAHVHAGVGAAGDRYEQNADLVADAVVAGQSAEALLDDVGPRNPDDRTKPGASTSGAGSTPQTKVARSGAEHAPCTTCGGDQCECNGSAKATAAIAQAVIQRSEQCNSAGVCQSVNDGVDESQSTSAEAPADSTSAPAISAPNSSPSPPLLRPPGNCTQDQWYALQQAVNQNCKTNMPRACAEGDTPEIINDKAAHFGRCIAARTTLNNTCFGGGDPGHLEELGNLTRGLARCERMRVPVPVPVPAPEEKPRTAPEADRGFMERMAAITGLSGAALIAYLIFSEGSRIVFPPRNLIPVP